MVKILVVDDEQRIREMIRKYAEYEGFAVDEACDGLEAVDKAMKENYDLIVMDIMMPNLDGFSACREIRKTHENVPVILLSALGEEYDKIHGFDLGVDDYVVKPFSPKELMMRIHAILKRTSQSEKKELIKINDLTIDFTGRIVKIKDEKLNLSPKEYDLLFYLVKNRGIALTREKLLQNVWGYDFFGDERTLKERFSRKDLIVALGGGVIGDLSGFVAATYMRGIEFINIPTTTLSQIDSSIGGKVAINLDGIKNCVGAFWQPKMVLIDPDVLATLPQRHINNGLAEALKAGLIRDESLFELFETDDPMEHIEKILYKSLMMKKKVVEIDEREIGVRRILNFGHTIGHGIESYYHLHDVYHGEAVALGMMKMIKDETIRERLHPIYQRLNLKEDIDYDRQQVYDFITKDKKIDGGTLTIVLLRKIGEAYLKDIPTEKIKEYL